MKKPAKKTIYDYSIDACEKTKNQFEECYSHDFVFSAALMPDAHSGYVAPIGAVLETKGYVVPSWVGFDIGCGLIALRIKAKDILKKIQEKKKEIYKEVLKKVPMGLGEVNSEKNITEKTKKEFKFLLEKFEKGVYDKKILNFLKNSALKHLGTLGAGNHFIEIGFHKKEVWVIIHSGSRGIGHEIAKKYMIKASSDKKTYEKTFPLEVKSQIGKEYLNILDFALDFALLNRLEMSYKIKEAIENVLNEKISLELWANKNHNHAIYEKGKFIHRKGATPAKKKEKGIIPGNMRDGTYLIEGLGNSKFLYSSSHGAGRRLSRAEAKKKITQEEFEKSMEGIQANLSGKIIDEAPMAYKNIDKVMNAQKKSVKIIKHIKPIINWKG